MGIFLPTNYKLNFKKHTFLKTTLIFLTIDTGE